MLHFYNARKHKKTPQNGQTYSKQFVDKLPTNCLIVFDHFVGFLMFSEGIKMKH